MSAYVFKISLSLSVPSLNLVQLRTTVIPPDPERGRQVLCRPGRVQEGSVSGDPNGSGNGDPCYEICRYSGGSGENGEASDSDSMLEPAVQAKINQNGEGSVPSYEEVNLECVQCKTNVIPVCAFPDDCVHPNTFVSDCSNELDGEEEAGAARFNSLRSKIKREALQSKKRRYIEKVLSSSSSKSRKKSMCPQECSKSLCPSYCPGGKQGECCQ